MKTAQQFIVNKLRLQRAELQMRTFGLRAKQIELERERACLAVDIANNDAEAILIDQQINVLLVQGHKDRVAAMTESLDQSVDA